MPVADYGKWGNQTRVTEFILVGFGNKEELQMFLFLVFAVIYIVTIAGNVIIVILVALDQHLHTPMYFFLANLSSLEVFYSSTILPKMLGNLLTGDKSISKWGCFTQFFCFGCLAIVECYLLSIMSYDRYVAICKPLHYVTIMNHQIIVGFMTITWSTAVLNLVVDLCLLSKLTFCGPKEIDHFFCDFSPLLQLSCSDTSHIRMVSLTFGSIHIMPPFILTVSSYIFIIKAIMRIPSTTGRKKAFSTCSSHLIVVTIFYGTLIIVYILPNNSGLKDLKKVFSLPYTIMTPMVNPLIYSLRNKEVKESLRKMLTLLYNRRLTPMYKHCVNNNIFKSFLC